MKDRVSITMLDDGVADVRLIRTEKMNALDPAMFAGIAEAIDVLEPVDKIIIDVSGAHFWDISAIAALDREASADFTRTEREHLLDTLEEAVSNNRRRG